MGVWEFVIVYLGVFLALQFVVYRYFRRGDGDRPASLTRMPNAESGPIDEDNRVDRGSRRHAARSTFASDGRGRHADSVRHCPSCGARNDPDGNFTFCWNCINPLSG